MNLDTIKQTALSMNDTLKLLAALEEKTDEASMKKRKELGAYIMKLAYSIQKCIDDERESI